MDVQQIGKVGDSSVTKNGTLYSSLTNNIDNSEDIFAFNLQGGHRQYSIFILNASKLTVDNSSNTIREQREKVGWRSPEPILGKRRAKI